MQKTNTNQKANKQKTPGSIWHPLWGGEADAGTITCTVEKRGLIHREHGSQYLLFRGCQFSVAFNLVRNF